MPWPKDTLTLNRIKMQSLPKFKNQYLSNAHMIKAHPEVWDTPQPFPNLCVYILYLGQTVPCHVQSLAWWYSLVQVDTESFKPIPSDLIAYATFRTQFKSQYHHITFFCLHCFKSFFPFFELPWYSVSIFVFIKHILVKFTWSFLPSYKRQLRKDFFSLQVLLKKVLQKILIELY